MKKYFITGGAGFIGSHLAQTLLAQEKESSVVIYDNFSSGKLGYLSEIRKDKRLKVVEADVKNIKRLTSAMKGADVVYHLASNPDISKAIKQPDIDFWEGTYLTSNVLEAMRINDVKKLLYASGSGIYGDAGESELDEDYALKIPISTYGASKLACEAMAASYCYMFGMDAAVFRFANVVGPKQTHGVGYDFVRKLKTSPKKLDILGDGKQSKSYLYVTDVIEAMRLVEKAALRGFLYYNVATTDYIAVSRIAETAVRVMGLKNVKFSFAGGSRGWKGDVPVVRMSSKKIRALGWKNKYTSAEAIEKSIKAIYEETK
jgi:UDP-glucose 4-epimerase